jgi:U4/U6.U5 tri-snRNP-associated protein 1
MPKLDLVPVAAERAVEEETQKLGQETADKTENDGLTFDDTSEFVRAISYTPAPVRESIIIKIDTSHMQDADEDNDQREAGDEILTELEADATKEEEMEEDETDAMLRTIEDAIKSSEVKTEDNEGPPADQVRPLIILFGVVLDLRLVVKKDRYI